MFSADDVILFGMAILSNLHNMMRVLNRIGQQSGLLTNLAKS